MKKSLKYLVVSIFLLMFASCSTQRKCSAYMECELTPEQRAEVKANGGFNPYYVPPERIRIKMPKKPRHLR